MFGFGAVSARRPSPILFVPTLYARFFTGGRRGFRLVRLVL